MQVSGVMGQITEKDSLINPFEIVANYLTNRLSREKTVDRLRAYWLH